MFWVPQGFWVKCSCWLVHYVSQPLNPPSILSCVWLELRLCGLCFFVASWLLVKLSRRWRGKGMGRERLSFFYFAGNSHGLFSQRQQLAPVFSSYRNFQKGAHGSSEVTSSGRWWLLLQSLRPNSSTPITWTLCPDTLGFFLLFPQP